MFKSAAALPTPSAPKKKGNAKEQHQIAGVEAVAMLAALIDAAEAARATVEGEVKAQAAAILDAAIQQTGRRPDSFDAVEGTATANVQLKKRASNLALSDAALAFLTLHGIEPHREVVVPQLYGINPSHANNAEAAAKIEAMMANGELPADYIVLQPEQSKFTVTDDVFEKAVAKKLPVAELLAVGSLVCKPRLTETNVDRLLDYMRALIAPSAQAAANEQAA